MARMFVGLNCFVQQGYAAISPLSAMGDSNCIPSQDHESNLTARGPQGLLIEVRMKFSVIIVELPVLHATTSLRKAGLNVKYSQ